MRSWHLAAAVSVFALGVTPARGQQLSGEVVDEQTRVPLVGLSVFLRRHAGDSSAIIDSARTDARGLFVVVAPGPGAYQLVFGVDEAGLAHGPVDTIVDPTSAIERRYLVPVTRVSETVGFYEFQVQKSALALSGHGVPRYPPDLKSNGIQGRVSASFVVDARGRAEPATFRPLESTNPGFTRAVREALPQMRFIPASIAGLVVRQRVQQAFEFRLDWARSPLPPPTS
jgi:TonB family protein